ncbi:GNAT family N-acetyltransferase [Hoeflea sp. TYP-13]|uniref:GNAT family N-acetyltransferase n=1 Tax=Hoeflea sp. TYP-13 TaxID=3230023 RepID=UPI0034C65A22
MPHFPEYEEIFPRPLSGAVVNSPPPALVPPRTPLSGELVKLEPQNAARHAQELYDAGHETEAALQIWDYMRYGPWPDVASYAATLRQQSASFDTIFYAIREHAGGTACGQASFLDIHPEDGVIEIGHIWFSPKLQRSRAATEALYLMLCHAMDGLGYRRMQWRCNALNSKSRNAARRLGFRFEGIFYNNLIFKGMNRDTAWYSILDDEWPDVRALISEWLDPSNFDAAGKARTSLSEAMKNRPDRERRVG